MTTVVFDFETIPNQKLIPRAANLRDTLEPPGNYKNEDTIEAWKDKQMEDMVSKMALHPMTGEICAAGYIKLKGNEEIDRGVIRSDLNGEAALLEEFTEVLNGYTKLISFNGKKFDVPYYHVRSRLNGTDFRTLPTNPYDQTRHIDLMLEIGSPMKLDVIRSWYGMEKRTESLGNVVWDLYQQGKFLEIADHCQDDVDATTELASMLGFLNPEVTVAMEDFA